MSRFDLATAQIKPTVSMHDASTQDHSTGDGQFRGLHNDLLFLWAMVDTENGKRYLRRLATKNEDTPHD